MLSLAAMRTKNKQSMIRVGDENETTSEPSVADENDGDFDQKQTATYVGSGKNIDAPTDSEDIAEMLTTKMPCPPPKSNEILHLCDI